MHRVVFLSGLLLLLASVPAPAQFSQYTAPGSAAEAPEDKEENAREEAETARWSIGKLLLEPRLEIGDVGYVENVFSSPDLSTQVNDSHAAIGAGLAGYLRLGSSSLLSAYVAPEYYWWQNTDQLREFTVSSGLGWFGSFNKLSLSTTARRAEGQQPLSLEIEAPVRLSEDTLDFEATVELTRRLAIFGEALESDVRHDRRIEEVAPELALLDLDRDSSRRLAGLELRGSDFELGLGYETTEVVFVNSDSRNNSGEGPSVRFNFDPGKLAFTLRYSDLEVSFENPEIPTQRSVVGQGLARLALRPRTSLAFYAIDTLSFTAISRTGIIESKSRGIDIRQELGKRLTTAAFAERGSQSFIDNLNPGRRDDLEVLGLRVVVELNERLTLIGQIREEALKSNRPEFDRSASTVQIGIKQGGDLVPW